MLCYEAPSVPLSYSTFPSQCDRFEVTKATAVLDYVCTGFLQLSDLVQPPVVWLEMNGSGTVRPRLSTRGTSPEKFEIAPMLGVFHTCAVESGFE
jgi:hypothetical protein